MAHTQDALKILQKERVKKSYKTKEQKHPYWPSRESYTKDKIVKILVAISLSETAKKCRNCPHMVCEGQKEGQSQRKINSKLSNNSA